MQGSSPQARTSTGGNDASTPRSWLEFSTGRSEALEGASGRGQAFTPALPPPPTPDAPGTPDSQAE